MCPSPNVSLGREKMWDVKIYPSCAKKWWLKVVFQHMIEILLEAAVIKKVQFQVGEAGRRTIRPHLLENCKQGPLAKVGCSCHICVKLGFSADFGHCASPTAASSPSLILLFTAVVYIEFFGFLSLSFQLQCYWKFLLPWSSYSPQPCMCI